ncbi:hypothetical protein T10_8868 [Trichinella papuae]|uniref:Uncharacterized protein n=1 Tax=Trichinella papuae TaxID=268474 RepID=A0A0V1NA09_9BILA|nr:hypothetical protein T10_8868 [Trichinella papuae]
MPTQSISSCTNTSLNLMSMCSMIYLGSTLFCDSFAIMSRTEADLIHAELTRSGQFSSCFCNPDGLFGLQPCAKWKIFIFLVRQNLFPKPTTIATAFANFSSCVSHLVDQLASPAFSDWEEFNRHGRKFLNYWQKNFSCTADIAVIVSDQIDRSVLIARFSDRILQMIRRDPAVHLTSDDALFIERRTSWYDLLRNFTIKLGRSFIDKAEQNKPSHPVSMPLWAVVILICSLVLVPVSIAIERLVFASRLLRMKKNSESRPQALLSHWRAGFAAGMLTQNLTDVKNRKVNQSSSIRVWPGGLRTQRISNASGTNL